MESEGTEGRPPTSPPSHYHLPSSGQNLTGAFTSLPLRLGGSDAAGTTAGVVRVAVGVAAGVARVIAGDAAGVVDGRWLILFLKEFVDDEVVALVVRPIAGAIVEVAVGVVAGVACA